MTMTGLLSLTPAFAGAVLSLPLELGPVGSVLSADYVCDGGAGFAVQYVNAEAGRFALIPIDGTETLFVNVVSGSGARYVSGPYEWWSKGEGATLSNAMGDGAALSCVAAETPAAD